MTFGLSKGGKWKKRVWPRMEHPKKLLRWNSVEVGKQRTNKHKQIQTNKQGEKLGLKIAMPENAVGVYSEEVLNSSVILKIQFLL